MLGVPGTGFQRREQNLCQTEGHDVRRALAGGYDAFAHPAGTASVKLINVAGSIAVLNVGGRRADGLYNLHSAFSDRELGSIHGCRPGGLHDG